MRRPSCQRHWPTSSMMYSPIQFISVPHFQRVRCYTDRLVSDQYTVCAGASGSDSIFLKERNRQLRKPDWSNKCASGYGGSKLCGQIRLLPARRHVGGNDVPVVKRE